VGAVLVHIDLEGDRPHPASLAALAAGRLVASSWGATLYAALVVHDNTSRAAPESTAQVVSAGNLPALESTQELLARAGADKIVVALTDVVPSPLWATVGGAWQGVLDHLRPRVVLFGADTPSSAELAPRTGARLGARLLMRARAIGVEDVELRDRDGGYVRSSDSGAAVAVIGGFQPAAGCDEDVDLVMLVMPGGADERVELIGSQPAELSHLTGVIVALGDDAAADAAIAKTARKLAAALAAPVVSPPSITRTTPLSPDVVIAIGNVSADVAGATSLIRIAPNAGKQVDGALTGPIGSSLTELVDALGGGS